MNRLVFLILILFAAGAEAQNICPNPGFEQIIGCPSGAGEINLAFPWTDAGTPADLFSFCHVNGMPAGCNDVSVPVNFAGYSSAHGGSTYAGFYTKSAVANQRTYLQIPLTAVMISGELYKITAFFKRSSASLYATNRIGIAFSTGALSQTGGQFIPVTPKGELINVVADTSGWTELKFYYSGTGLEDQLIIGNFRNDGGTTAFNFTVAAPSCPAFAGSAFYYTDDISVTKITESTSVTGDTLICTGESTTLTGITNTEGWWSLLSTPADTIPTPNNSITVNPVVSTGYIWHGIQTADTVTVSVTAAPVAALPADTTVCQGTTVNLDATNILTTYLWSTGAITPYIIVADSGQYVVTVDNGSCSVKDTFKLSILTSPDVFLGGTATVCSDNQESVTLNAGPGNNYVWSPTGDTTSALTVTEPGIYSVQVFHANGCFRSDTVIISEICTETLFVPGAFTPNGDSKNDFFYADGTNILEYSIIIFNRWGQPVYTTQRLGPSGAWNGKDEVKPVPEGLYSYIIHYKALKTNGKFKKERKSGYFILFR